MTDLSVTEEEIQRCTLTGKREVVYYLQVLTKQKEPITVSFGHNHNSFLTLLIGVNDDTGWLYLDVGGSEMINHAFLKADHLTFSTMVDGIQYRFTTGAGRETKVAGERVFAVPLPKALLRLQRREFYRLQLPQSHPFVVRIKRGLPGERSLPIFDISVGGIGIQTQEFLDYGQTEILENCRLDLRDFGFLSAALEVRYISSVTTKAGRTLWHMGCRFVKLTPADETLIQRFMARMESELKSLTA